MNFPKFHTTLVAFLSDHHSRFGKRWPHFLWSISLGEERFEYRMGSGHFTPLYKNKWEREWSSMNKKPSPEHVRTAMDGVEGWAKPPSMRDVLASLVLDARAGSESFNEFCDNSGYSNDSITALNIYRDCAEIGIKVRRIFPGAEFDKLEKWIEEQDNDS